MRFAFQRGSWTSDEHVELKDNVHGYDFEIVWTGKTCVDWAVDDEGAAE